MDQQDQYKYYPQQADEVQVQVQVQVQVPSFQEGVTEIIMACEELRQQFKTQAASSGTSLPTLMLVHGRADLEEIVANLGGMHHQLQQQQQQPATAQEEDHESLSLNRDLFQHCQERVAQVAQLVLERALASDEPQEDDDDESQRRRLEEEEQESQQAQQRVEAERRDFQASIARIMELNFMLAIETQQHEQRIPPLIEQYVAYQRNALRQRAKPSIARLAQDRPRNVKSPHNNNNDNSNNNSSMPHSHVITVVLGQASALIHPLLAWMFSLPPEDTTSTTTSTTHHPLVEAIRKLCSQSVQILDEQAQTLTKTISDWFWEDRQVDDWMAKSNDDDSSFFTGDHKLYLGQLDALVEEMAFCCQVLARYQALIQDAPRQSLLPNTNTTSSMIIEQELSPEWTWKYSTLERFLATQQWKSALMLATPVHIVLGTSIQVPSVVEDAQYLSTRALERAASTRSTQAIGTVAHAISTHIWSTDNIRGGVHQALTDQIGCIVDESTAAHADSQQQQHSPPKSAGNSFAMALLDALDDDIDTAASYQQTTPRAPTSGPSSGGLFQSLIVGGGDALQQLRINTDFCNLNGIHSASTACRSLVRFLDGLLENPDATDANEGDPTSAQQLNAMIELAREELSHYSHAYDAMLKARVQQVIAQWCGSLEDPPNKRKSFPCVPLLRYYFLHETYELDQGAFKAAESDSRLERDLLGALNESKFLQQLQDKSDAEVLTEISEELSQIIVELVLDCLLRSDPPKRFTDWGSLLLSKQVRMLKLYLAKLQDTTTGDASSQARHHSNSSYQAWERLSQVVAVLQLERPSDWALYQSTSVLTPQELRLTMHLRVDFSAEAINAVVGTTSIGDIGSANGQNGSIQ
jgi:hypothetical protein